MFDLWASENSTLREKLLEHAFLTELSKVLLLERRMPMEILRAEFDANGYDVVIEANGVLRYVQFKAMRLGGKRRNVDIARALASKSGGCVIWFVADESDLTLGPFYWLGGRPGEHLPDLGDKVTRHSKANAQGIKGERAGHRRVPIAKFDKFETMDEVALAMFGAPDPFATSAARAIDLAMVEENQLDDGPVGVTQLIGGWDPPRQVLRYELRDGKIFATWIAPSGAFASGEVPLFGDGDGFYDVFGRFLGNSPNL